MPEDYQRATARGVLPVDSDGEIGISFDTASGETIRLLLSAHSAEFLAYNLQRSLNGSRLDATRQ